MCDWLGPDRALWQLVNGGRISLVQLRCWRTLVMTGSKTLPLPEPNPHGPSFQLSFTSNVLLTAGDTKYPHQKSVPALAWNFPHSVDVPGRFATAVFPSCPMHSHPRHLRTRSASAGLLAVVASVGLTGLCLLHPQAGGWQDGRLLEAVRGVQRAAGATPGRQQHWDTTTSAGRELTRWGGWLWPAWRCAALHCTAGRKPTLQYRQLAAFLC